MCGSSRRRPITSPPGGGAVTRPKRASSGPASRNDARMREQSSGSSSSLCAPAGSMRTSLSPVHSTSQPMSASSAHMVWTSRMRGTFDSSTGAEASSVAASTGSAPFLFPAARTLPWRGRPPSMTKLCDRDSATATDTGGTLAAVSEVTRERAWQTLTQYTKSEALLRHALAVEASTGAYAAKFGEDEELWRATALLHDFDYEIHPTLDKHPQDGAPILREEGYPEELVESILSHAEHLNMERDTKLKKTLVACDELAGFVYACGLVRPDGIETLEPKSVRKKLKQPSFASGVNRDDVYAGAELLGVELNDHIAFVTGALRPIARELGLRTAADVPA